MSTSKDPDNTNIKYTKTAGRLSSTPAEIDILPRKPEFNFAPETQAWLRDPVISHFFNAWSVFIPVSERVVIDIMRELHPRINDPELGSEIKALIRQEGAHARLHQKSNDLLLKAGYKFVRPFCWLHKKAMKMMLCLLPKATVPVAFEHFTSVLSIFILENKAMLTGPNKNGFTEFLEWHALEELEHQAVCYDVYHAFYPNRRFMLSVHLLLIWLPLVIFTVYGTQLCFMAKDGLLRHWHHWNMFFHWFGVTAPRMITGIGKYTRPGYTPWSGDALVLYNKALEEYNKSR